LNDKDISRMSESNLASIRGRTIGFVFQQFNLIPTLTAAENVMLPMIFQGIPPQKRNDVAKRLLTSLGLGDRMHHKPNELSGGQSQRVAISRSLANNPDVVLADEPTGNLDSKTGADVMKTLESIHKKEGKTIVLVTHDLDLVHHAERVIYLKDGGVEKVKKRRR
jgi:putative ABC transport system ATP-binding protein